MDEKKEKSIWDEVDSQETVLSNVEDSINKTDSETSEDTENNTGSKESDTDTDINTKNFYGLRIKKDDNADRKGLISIIAIIVCALIFAASIVGIVVTVSDRNRELKDSQDEMARLRDLINLSESDAELSGGAESIWGENIKGEADPNRKVYPKPDISDKYKDVYALNNDLIGWLKIDDTLIDYPVMQTPKDEEYYLHRGFDGSYNENGCLIMDTDSNVGTGSEEEGYLGGSDRPSDNLIIHGHTMQSGEMFGELELYKDKKYADEHKIIKFDTLYESREYEVIAVFYSQVYYQNDDCFKYYKFFNADNQEEFDDWYDNIKEMSIYDTHVKAKFGDQFITLSCCSYHVEDGRFVVVGKRIK